MPLPINPTIAPRPPKKTRTRDNQKRFEKILWQSMQNAEAIRV